jgi:hypothetical protein
VVDLKASLVTLEDEAVAIWEDVSTGAQCEARTVVLDRGCSFEEAMQVM